MQYLNSVYATAFNEQNRRYGHVLHGRYGYRLIEQEDYFCTVARYIALNPVNANIVPTPGEWKYSSFRAIACLERAPLFLDKAGLLSFFGDPPLGTPHSFLQFLGQAPLADLEFNEDLVLLRPTLRSLFDQSDRDEAIINAVRRWKYTLREVGKVLGLSTAAVGKVVKKVEKGV